MDGASTAEHAAMPRETSPFTSTDPDSRAGQPTLVDPLACTAALAGEFALERRLGRGAFGEVWLARDLSPLGRQVALKFLRFTDAKPQAAAEQALAVLKNEARVLAS